MPHFKGVKYYYAGLFLVLLFVAPLSAQVNRCAIRLNGRHGYIDTLGNVVIRPRFDNALQFSENLASVKRRSKYGFIDTTGRFVIKPAFDVADPFKQGLARVMRRGRTGLIDRQGNYVLRPGKQHVYTHNEGMAAVKRGERWAFYDVKSRRFTGGFIYEDAGDFYNGMAAVKLNGLYGFINKSGKVIITPTYRQVLGNRFSEGMAGVRSNDKSALWGYIDTAGNLLNGYRYSWVSDFKEGRALVFDKWNSPGYFINKKGEKLFDKTFDRAWGFQEGLCGVTVNNKQGIIDSLGNWVMAPQVDFVSVFYSHGCIGFYNKVDGRALWGLISRSGRILLEPRYAGIVFGEGDCPLPAVFEGDCADDLNRCRRGYVNREGRIIWKPSE